MGKILVSGRVQLNGMMVTILYPVSGQNQIGGRRRKNSDEESGAADGGIGELKNGGADNGRNDMGKAVRGW